MGKAVINLIVVETKNLSKRYGHIAALENLSIEIAKGEIFGLLGPNGAGKSTTIALLLGLTVPSEGTVSVVGLDPVREPLAVKKRVGCLPERMSFYHELSGRENLLLVAQLNSDTSNTITASDVDSTLDLVGLREAKDELFSTYSRGMRQRLGLASVLVKKPELVILDEPTLGLDPEGKEELLSLIEKLHKEMGLSVIFCSHQLQQAERLCQSYAILNKGKIVAEGKVDDVKKHSSLEELYLSYFRNEEVEK